MCVVDIVVYKGAKYRRYPNGGKSHRKYFWSSTKYEYLHRRIWEDNFGEIPEGNEIHHRDDNTLNNDPSNFECLTKLEHLRLHKENGFYENRKLPVKTCVCCKTSFEAPNGRSLCCSLRCKKKMGIRIRGGK